MMNYAWDFSQSGTEKYFGFVLPHFSLNLFENVFDKETESLSFDKETESV